jgi:hypothetical protein
MSISRRDFMKVFGTMVASIVLTRCNPSAGNPTPTPTYQWKPYPTRTPMSYPTVPASTLSARERLRNCWLGFDLLEVSAKATWASSKDIDWSNPIGQQMMAEHHASVEELVASGELSRSVADLIQEAYDTAVYHVWRSNLMATCYFGSVRGLYPMRAEKLLDQLDVLEEIDASGAVVPETVERIRMAIEREMAYYGMTDEEEDTFHHKIFEANDYSTEFEDTMLELTPEAKTAAQFIIDLLTGK